MQEQKNGDDSPTTHTVTFSPNGGTGAMAPVEVKDGQTYALPACGFTAPAGQKFSHWEIGGRSYNPGDRITVTGNLTAKAVYGTDQAEPEISIEIDFDHMTVENGVVTLNVQVYVDGNFLFDLPLTITIISEG